MQRLVGVDGHGRPDTLVGTLEGLIVGREDVQIAGHPGRCEVCQVLAALLLMVRLPLVAVPTWVPTLRAAGGKRGRGGGSEWGYGTRRHRDPPTSPVLTLRNLHLQALITHHLIVIPSLFRKINHKQWALL